MCGPARTIRKATGSSNAGTGRSSTSAFVPRRRGHRPKSGRLEEARRLVAAYVEHYNHARLNIAIGYVTPADKLNGLAQVIFDERDRKLVIGRIKCSQWRQQARQAVREVA
jgi:hypothetical protein